MALIVTGVQNMNKNKDIFTKEFELTEVSFVKNVVYAPYIPLIVTETIMSPKKSLTEQVLKALRYGRLRQ